MTVYCHGEIYTPSYGEIDANTLTDWAVPDMSHYGDGGYTSFIPQFLGSPNEIVNTSAFWSHTNAQWAINMIRIVENSEGNLVWGTDYSGFGLALPEVESMNIRVFVDLKTLGATPDWPGRHNQFWDPHSFDIPIRESGQWQFRCSRRLDTRWLIQLLYIPN